MDFIKLSKTVLCKSGTMRINAEFISNGHWIVPKEALHYTIRPFFSDVMTCEAYLGPKVSVGDITVEATKAVYDLKSLDNPDHRWQKTPFLVEFKGDRKKDTKSVCIFHRYGEKVSEFCGIDRIYADAFDLQVIYGEQALSPMCAENFVIMPARIDEDLSMLTKWIQWVKVVANAA
jgi:hypothetical protein